MSTNGTPLPTSKDAYEGIEFFPVAIELDLLPKNVSGESLEGRLELTFSFAGTYTYRLFAQCHERDGKLEVAYYVAYNLRNQRSEFAVGPDRVQDFEDQVEVLASAAGLFFGMGREAHPAAIDIVVSQRHALAGRPWKAIKANMRAAGKMWKDPVMVLGAAADVGAIGQIHPRVQPRIKPVPKVPPPPLPEIAPIVSPVYRISGRDIVIVDTSVGRQAFYRSSGVNSGQPGRWFPLDEVRPVDNWFNKTGYTKGEGLQKGSRLHRVGTPEFEKISDQLGKRKIRSPTEEVPSGVFENSANTLNRILDFFDVRVTKTTNYRPVDRWLSDDWLDD